MESFGAHAGLQLGAGLLAGTLHLLSGPDHLVTVLPIGLEARERGWRVALQWGIGHALGIMGVALAAYGLRGWLDLEILRDGSHWLTAGVLVGVGVWGLSHRHSLDAALSRPDVARSGHGHVHTTMAFVVGTAHGVAGTGALLGVIPVLGMDSWLAVAAYLSGFGAGMVLPMLAFGVMLGSVAGRVSSLPRWARIYRGAFTGACWVAIAVGVLLIVAPDLH